MQVRVSSGSVKSTATERWWPTLTAHDPTPPLPWESPVGATQELAGTASVTIGQAGTLEIVKELAGSAAIAVGASADLELVKELAGSAAIAIGATGALSLVFDLAGAASVTVDESADLQSLSDSGVRPLCCRGPRRRRGRR